MTPIDYIDLSEKHDLPDCIGAGIPAKWEPAVTEAILKIQELIAQGHKIKIQQIKEKFGGLRLYVMGKDLALCNDIIREAETKCANTCVVCGSDKDVKRGVRDNDSHWLLALCSEHRYTGGSGDGE